MDTFVKDAKKLGVASILSETYGTNDTLNRAEYWKQSWMYWIYKGFGNKVNEYADKLEIQIY
jgi:hypothetical protein